MSGWFSSKPDQQHQQRQEHPTTGTTLIHSGEQPNLHGEVMPSICVSTTFRQRTPGVPIGEYDYTRAGNPTRRAFEEAVAASEHGKYGFAFSSGMAAMSTVLCMLRHGDTVIAIDDVYGGVDRLLRQVAVPQWGVRYEQSGMEDMDDLQDKVRRACENGRQCMVWLETPTNPLLKVVDLHSIVQSVRSVSRDTLIVVDNTFATPILQNPLHHHVSMVCHSVTKYIGGHSDVLMGAVITNDQAVADRLQFLQKAIGAVPSPFDCFMALRGLKTLHVRIRQHCQSALQVAQFLSKSDKISRVYYPGLPTNKYHDLASRQMHHGYGGMVSFTLQIAKTMSPADTLAVTVRFCQALRVITLAESLGGVESLMDVPSVMTHASVPPHHRQRLGITDGLLRLSVGLEETGDLIDDLQGALMVAFAEHTV